MTVDVVSYGETMGLLDGERIGPLRLGGTMRLSIAGAESTVAIGVARLGGSARWVGVVGDDEIGDLVTRVLRAEGVNTDGVVVRPEARIVHVSGITPALSPTARDATFHALGLAENAGTLRSVDVNYRLRLWEPEAAQDVLTDMVKHADIVFATLEETALITTSASSDPATAAESIARLGPELVVVKLGSDGAAAWHDGRVHRAPPVPTAVFSVACPGDCEGLPTHAEVKLLGGADVVR